MKTFLNTYELSKWRLCSGCGACAAICPSKNIILINKVQTGIRPQIRENKLCHGCHAKECLKVCPYEYPKIPIADAPDWGPIKKIFLGHATQSTLRFQASSGGIASAIAIFCLEAAGIDGVIHVGPDPRIPWQNRTIVSTTPADIIRNVGSRYSPASPCEGLKHILTHPGKYIFIGKPCDICACQKAMELYPILRKRITLTIGIFCAGTPTSLGTLHLAKSKSISPQQLSKVSYRGHGWPGRTIIHAKANIEASWNYSDAWGFLQRYRPYRCHLCPDGTSELADISCGDAWHLLGKSDSSGLSLILARTTKGLDILKQAFEKKFISLQQTEFQSLSLAQANLLKKKQTIWGRIFAFQLLGLPHPIFNSTVLRVLWARLSATGKVKSVAGTLKRIFLRKYYLPEK